jgi:8-oxo-dGTP pyrophosphatase MutT (NUDIX family)
MSDPVKDLLDKVPRRQKLAGHLILPSVAALIVDRSQRMDDGEVCSRFLVSKRSGEYRPGFWQFPGGMIDTGETLVEAALREVKEEVGKTDLEYRGICHVDDTVLDNNHWVCVFLLFEALSPDIPPNPEPDKNEGWWWNGRRGLFQELRPLMPGMIPAVKAYFAKELIDRD